MDPQIVNGLQTSREIFNHFSKPEPPTDGRSVLVRVIETDDDNLQATIIKATNSQNKMAAAQLRMTDQIHRDLEQIFKQAGLFYDRRKGFYRDQGKPISKIVSVNEMAQAPLAILLQRPNDARARPGDYFKDDDRYKSIFGEGVFPLPVYLKCVNLVRAVERFLQGRGVGRGDINNLRFYIAAMVAREITGMMTPVAPKLLSVGDVGAIDPAIIEGAYKVVSRAYERLAEKVDGDTVARGTELLKRLNSWSKRQQSKKAKQK